MSPTGRGDAVHARKQLWIHSPYLDGFFILLPAFFATALAFVWRERAETGVGPWGWLIFVVGIDVAHVYATMYRTYFDRDEFSKRRRLYVGVPLAAFLVGCVLHSIAPWLFWRVLAYLAVHHFVRQQDGFMRFYSRPFDQRLSSNLALGLPSMRSGWRFLKEVEASMRAHERLIDRAVIFMATLYPLTYWHVHGRAFEWFVTGDFMVIPLPALSQAARIGYIAAVATYVLKEIASVRAEGFINVPKNLVLLGTAVSWYVGIVHFNGDLAFTVTNVIAHGVPYLALVWAVSRRDLARRPSLMAAIFRPAAAPLYLLPLLALAYVEEGFWDGLVWREHASVLPWAQALPKLADPATLSWVVPLLALPQITHYILDGFIWRIRDEGEVSLDTRSPLRQGRAS